LRVVGARRCALPLAKGRGTLDSIVTATNVEIIYTESLRKLADQRDTRDSIRARAGTLLTAASIVTAFLGAQALSSHQTVVKVGNSSVTHTEINSLGWAAVGCFIGILIACICLIVPWRWDTTHDAHYLLEEFYEATPPPPQEELYQHLAFYNEDAGQKNESRIKTMAVVLSAACLVLAAEAVLWLLDVV
jgi:uncharacterized membrane protein